MTPRLEPPPSQPDAEANVRADELTQEQKRQLWGWMRRHDPQQAAFFDDPAIARLLKQGAVPLFTVAYLQGAGIDPPQRPEPDRIPPPAPRARTHQAVRQRYP